jgi:TPR repeat protein
MTDIFVSYKSEERDRAQQLAEVLSQIGYDVWWDASLLAGSQFTTEIEEVIKGAKAVIVLWSRAAIKSEWVKAEAEAARRRGIALSVRIDDVSPDDLPLLFRATHIVDLADWKGNKKDAAFAQLLAAVRNKAGPPRKVRSKEEASQQLRAHTEEAEFWQTISLSPMQSAAEYRAYLERFGVAAKWSELAHARIVKLETEERAKQPKRLHALAHRTGLFLGAAAAAVTVLAFFGMSRSDDVKQWFSQIAGLGIFKSQSADSQEARECRRLASPLGLNTHLIDLLKSQVEMNQPALAVEWCEAALKKNPDDPGLLSLAARAYFDTGDIKRAYANAQLAAKSGNPDGMEILGTIEYPEKGSKEDYTTALENYRKAADEGNATAQYYLGRMHALGLGVDKNEEKAVEYYRMAADQDNKYGLLMLGYSFANGIGVPATDKEANNRKAFDLYRRAADLGYHVAQNNLGSLYATGKSTDVKEPEQRYKQAVKYYERAARQGYALAQSNLGLLYANNQIGVEMGAGQRYAEALRWLKPAAEQDADRYAQALAQGALGWLYMHGNAPGVTNQDDADKMAVGYLQMAANKGESVAEYNLAVMYRDGRGVDKSDQTANNRKAFELFERSANKGYSWSQLELGRFYLSGRGAVPDRAKAIEWLKKAAAQGLKEAEEQLTKLK